MRRYHWLEELHNAHYGTLLRLAQNRLRAGVGSTSEAEDVVQDVFLLAAEKDIRDLNNPLPWLMKATVNMCLKRYQRKKQNAEKEQRFIRRKLENSIDRSVYAVEREDSKAASVELLMTIEQLLSPEEWDILRQYCLQGIPIEEISAQRGIPSNTLRVRICRIRKKLAKIYPEM